MNKILHSCCFLFALFSGNSLLLGQTDSLYTLSEVEITSLKIREQALGSESQEWSKAAIERLSPANLSDLLNEQTGTYIKSYGLGSLATSSIRGGSAGHTLVLWNGLPIQSPMLGQLDLALLPIEAYESIKFQKGGNSALWGSGAIGGVISLNNQVDFTQRLSINAQSVWGDLGRFNQHLKISLGNSKIQSSTKIFYQKADNDFFYTPAPGLQKKQQKNANLLVKNILQDVYWKINEKNRVSLHFWKQDSERELPPTNVQNSSEARQEDKSTRFILDWQNLGKKTVLQSKVGFFDEYLDYFDEQISLTSKSHFQTAFGETSIQRNLGEKHQLYLGATHTYTRAWSVAYQEVPSEHKSALFASWKWTLGNLILQSNLRQEAVNGKTIPVVPSIAFSYALFPSLQVKGKVSRNYRLATFNDRFWRPGGNENLLPESGWSEEIGLVYSHKIDHFSFTSSLTGFNRNIENWIMWSIQEGQRYWSANNITKVWSRGLEPRVSMGFKNYDFNISWAIGYDYIRSTNQFAIEFPKIPAGAQLIYTPVHQAFSTFTFGYRSLSFSYQHTYKGKTQGINDHLEAFQVANARIQYSFKADAFHSTLFFRVNNVWNKSYLVVERRPMPGINYQFGININFNKNQSQ